MGGHPLPDQRFDQRLPATCASGRSTAPQGVAGELLLALNVGFVIDPVATGTARRVAQGPIFSQLVSKQQPEGGPVRRAAVLSRKVDLP
ncbi:hypothetical protein [Aminobacter ciceronei]|uniref:Uncharacterized protein n=1 Tax=Aminobacter ciceronei TaxID=150723 RepID=A0ABR6C8J1_9HYPH|nr:hypothetical protein [Aminobacter ciceronei]MBA8907594.1 hypothetical protein [Aminobacter ciceronei]MBA9021305.1 hypothetical protein [Aminobacter ciceronei]